MPIHPLLAITRTTGNPVIESEAVTFVWQGKTTPHLIDDLHNWEENPHIMKHAGLESNRYMYTLLKDKNYTIKFHEYSEGHNFTAWRDDILRGLETLFRY